MREHRRNPLALAANGAEQSPLIKAAPAPGNNGLRVSWLDDQPGQFYLQTANQRDSIDLSSYVDNGGALVFDAVLHAPPPDDTAKIAVHCQYPCVAELPATSLFGGLPVEKQAAVKIPLSCFVSAGLDPRKVNTPFVVYSQRRMDVTFANVCIETGAADDADATSCTELR